MEQDIILEAKYRLASMNGYNGPKSHTALDTFAQSSPMMTAKFNAIGVGLAAGGYIKGYQEGGSASGNAAVDEILKGATGAGASDATQDLNNDGKVSSADALLAAQNAGLTSGAASEADVSGGEKEEETSLEDFQEQQQDLVKTTMAAPEKADVTTLDEAAGTVLDESKGQVGEYTPITAKTGTAQTISAPADIEAATYDAVTAAGDVADETAKLEAEQGDAAQYEDKIKAARLTAGQSELMTNEEIKAVKGNSIDVEAPADREIEDGEMINLNEISGQAQKAAKFAEQVQYATATPTKQATVAGQLEGLMQDFEGGQTPPWAAGAMRAATATMAARGLTASSMAGQAIIQAAMEAALPIAQADAATQAQFESQNLSNKQQRAMLAAQQRAQFIGQEFDQAFQARVTNAAKVSDIANMNFTAEQQIALENSRAANTMNLNNVNNGQAIVLAKASALANMDLSNLSNAQQAAVQNAQNFLQMDMANLSNRQQTAIFKTQQNVQAILSDQAAQNAALQFNAQSENQANQFNANMEMQASQFNAAQQNAMEQFNVGQENAVSQFNASTKNQRQMFNAQNELVVAQANAQWRQNIETVNTAAENAANQQYASAMNGLSAKNLDAIWQAERDAMSEAFTASESGKDRALSVLLADKELTALREKLDSADDAAKTELALKFLFGSDFGGLSGLLG